MIKDPDNPDRFRISRSEIEEYKALGVDLEHARSAADITRELDALIDGAAEHAPELLDALYEAATKDMAEEELSALEEAVDQELDRPAESANRAPELRVVKD
ncbi:hypothetical protein [Thioalkalivibrio thiocyanodenitrificans]|uniref:hypothetical protein n=1 Tax=Thioalkalivibrio thiocyanodenitrificans TaxID=243063 RepID=UPI00036BE6E2|nr:hypothetical protein [Thioalkalivibrio thiocyanodenitrificans]